EAQLLNPGDKVEDHKLITEVTTKTLDVPAGSTVSLPLQVFFGPKQRDLLASGYYEADPRHYEKSLVYSSSCNFCTFGWLVNVLVTLLGAFHWVFGGFVGHGDWGLAIIALVLVVRLILHPITKRSTISMQKMGKMGPEMERLKKKYADNKDELNKAMMTFYKEQGFTPVLGCLPMFLQMPIWIALWGALQSTFDLRQEPFLWGWTWIKDLAKPDALITFKQPIHLLFFTIASINILPVLMAIVYFLQQKYTPKPPASTKEQEQQQKMMQWMTLLFPVMLYGGPAGLNLYIVTSAGIGIIESKRIRDHIKQREEDEKAGRIIVDAKPTRGARRGDGGATEPAKKPNPLAQWIAEMMAKADRVRDDARKRKP
ncbi:MAG TPA: membrane protein insertase YidC, partial [Tepidisphaeraceae bacterium]